MQLARRHDPIVAIATASGRGAVGIVRVSGEALAPLAEAICGRALVARHATHVAFRAADGTTIDRGLAIFFPAPHSYTGEDVLELQAHGGAVVLQLLLARCLEAAAETDPRSGGARVPGLRIAAPGEFTERAFLNDKLELAQAEAVADLIDAVTPLQARAAFDQLEGTLTERIAAIDAALFDLIARLEASVDFPEEGYHFIESGDLAGAVDGLVQQTFALLVDGRRGRMIREGLQIAIVGKPNVGKSSLFNALAGSSRAIVTPTPGTTRDLITETIDINGLRVTLVDSAGIRTTDDEVEAVGVGLARRAIEVADAVLVVVDGSSPLDDRDVDLLRETSNCKRVVAANKCDLGMEVRGGLLAVSAKTGAGLAQLRDELAAVLDADATRDQPAITNLRHVLLVEKAHDALSRARSAIGERGRALPEEFVLADLQEARGALEEISGKRAPDDLLAHIFARFCVGK